MSPSPQARTVALCVAGLAALTLSAMFGEFVYLVAPAIVTVVYLGLSMGVK